MLRKVAGMVRPTNAIDSSRHRSRFSHNSEKKSFSYTHFHVLNSHVAFIFQITYTRWKNRWEDQGDLESSRPVDRKDGNMYDP